MKLYVMRHGQTDWNVLGKIQGISDTELNETGIKQAKEAKEKFNQLEIDLIFCSPLKRTRKTVEIINQDKQVPVFYENKIMERGFGDLEGVKFGEEEAFKKYDFWNYHENANHKNVEPIVDCCNKVWRFLEKIKEKYHGKNILIVTHGGTAKVINAYFAGIDENGKMPHVGMQNCEIREYEL